MCKASIITFLFFSANFINALINFLISMFKFCEASMTHNLKSVVTWSFLDLAICKNPAFGPII